MWTDERVAELKELIAAGNSMGMIAAKWDVPRNAICGKAWRLGLSGPNARNMGGIAVVFKKRAEKKEKRAKGIAWGEIGETRITRLKKARAAGYTEPKFAFCPDEPEPLRISLLDLTDSHCHWVCEGTDDHCLPTYCGHPSADGRWCAHHYRRVHP